MTKYENVTIFLFCSAVYENKKEKICPFNCVLGYY